MNSYFNSFFNFLYIFFFFCCHFCTIYLALLPLLTFLLKDNIFWNFLFKHIFLSCESYCNYLKTDYQVEKLDIFRMFQVYFLLTKNKISNVHSPLFLILIKKEPQSCWVFSNWCKVLFESKPSKTSAMTFLLFYWCKLA